MRNFLLLFGALASLSGCMDKAAAAPNFSLPDVSDAGYVGKLDAAGPDVGATGVPPADAAAVDSLGPEAGSGADAGPAPADVDNGACGPFDDGVYGAKKPWQGFSKDGKTFACNVCRGGYANLQGSWRFIDFETEDPATPVDTSEKLTFDGNTYTDRIAGVDLNKPAEQTSNGWYFCSDPAEMSSMDAVFVIEQAVPNGAFGNTAGDAFRVSVKVSTSNPNLIALGLSEGLTGKFIGEFLYCRIGTTIGASPCKDPFAP